MTDKKFSLDQPEPNKNINNNLCVAYENNKPIKSSLKSEHDLMNDVTRPRRISFETIENDMWNHVIENLPCLECEDGIFKNLPELKALMVERRKIGIDRYGTPLKAFNGRNCVDDIISELLDAVVYIEQYKWEKCSSDLEGIKNSLISNLLYLLEIKNSN